MLCVVHVAHMNLLLDRIDIKLNCIGRAVFDTNVLASGFVSQTRVLGELPLLWTDDVFEIVVSDHIPTELAPRRLLR